MTDNRTDVLVAGYDDVDAATADFDGLMQIVRDHEARIEGAILVTHDEDGEVTVRQHGDHRGRKGLGWGAGGGLVVGLFSPPLLGSIAVGAAAGGLLGRFTDHRVESGTHDEIGQTFRLGPPRSSPCSTTNTASPSSAPCRGR